MATMITTEDETETATTTTIGGDEFHSLDTNPPISTSLPESSFEASTHRWVGAFALETVFGLGSLVFVHSASVSLS